ncbi:uncharacterized protein LOC131935658 [Physella acuta]|uniref:uncharacterized protein LOC131935658 n=1 Tax=Physella acuta TaxID=109671 RepID=UPI0027DCC0D4|nr:uncharacterized protein LOC131935658 [Physella acuta]
MEPGVSSAIVSLVFLFIPSFMPVLSASVRSVGITKKENSTDIAWESVIENFLKESTIDNITESLLGEDHNLDNERGNMLDNTPKFRNISNNLNNEHHGNVHKSFRRNALHPKITSLKQNSSSENKTHKLTLLTESQNPKMNLSEASRKPEVNETESRTPPEKSKSLKDQQESPHPKADVPEAEALPSIVNRGRKYLHKIDPTTFIRWHMENKSAIFERGLLSTTREDCSFGYVRHDDRCYSVFDVLTHFDDCVVICHLFNGSISMPTSATTRDFIHRQVTDSVAAMSLTVDNPYWLGVTYIKNAWRSYHTPSTVIKYLYWAPGEPKTLAPNECAAARLSDGLWMTYDCRLWAYCICDSELMDIQNVSPYG